VPPLLDRAIEPVAAGLERACAERLGCPVVQGYGLTETTTAVSGTAGAPLGPRHGSVGVLLPDTEARIVDPASGQDLGTGEPGELQQPHTRRLDRGASNMACQFRFRGVTQRPMLRLCRVLLSPLPAMT
jgi:acyl-CoA synthetase (AMP-forming)/AMP-acid ligase II